MAVEFRNDTIESFGELSPAEELVLTNYCEGRPTPLGVRRPDRGTPGNSIRADFLRYLLLGGCEKHRPRTTDVDIRYARISGNLDIHRVRTELGLVLVGCHFDGLLNAADSHLSNLFLRGSSIEGLSAGRATIAGSVNLDDRFRANGAVNLAGAEIGGQLVCSNGRFVNADGYALNAQGAIVTSDVFLKGDFHATGAVSLAGAEIGGQLNCIDGRFENADGYALNAHSANVAEEVFLRGDFHATGIVSLSGADIGGQLSCRGGRFENAGGFALNAQNATVKGSAFFTEGFHATGEVSLSGAEFGGQLACIGGRFDNAGGYALSAQSIKVTGPLLWYDVRTDSGAVDFQHAHIRVLNDDEESWPSAAIAEGESRRVLLNGFRYDAIHNDARADTRLKWLEKCLPDQAGPEPQPYEQLAKVLGEMGHRRDRGAVLMELERILRKDWSDSLRIVPDGTWRLAWNSIRNDVIRILSIISDSFLRWFVGYGHRPAKAVLWGLGFIILTGLLADVVWNAGDIVPNSPVVLVSERWQVFANDPNVGNPALLWSAPDGPGRDYETFNALAYAADVFVPIVDLGQETAWAPTTARGWQGQLLFYLLWLVKAFGWIITALGAAAVTGIIRREP